MAVRNVVFDLKFKLGNADASLGTLSKRLETAEDKFRKAKKGSVEYIEAQKELNQINRKLGGSFERTTKRASGFQRTMKKAVLALGGLAIVSQISQSFRQGISTVIDFEDALADLSAITGATGGDLEFYEQQAREVGSTTTLSAQKAVQAFKLIGSARPQLLENSEALAAVTKEAVILAEAARLELPEAAAALTTVLNQFNLTADQSRSVIDALAQGSLKGAADVPTLTKTIKSAGTVLAQNNVSFEEAIALTETLADKQLVGAEAGTALRGVILKLSKEGKGYVDGQFNIQAALEQVREEFDNIQDPAERSRAAVKLFGEEGITAGNILLSNTERFKELTEEVKESGGALEQQAKNTDTTRGALDRLSNKWDELMLTLGSSRGTLKEITESLGGILDITTNFIKNLGEEGFSLPNLKKSLAEAAGFGPIFAGTRKQISEEEREAYRRVQSLRKTYRELEDLLRSGGTDLGGDIKFFGAGNIGVSRDTIVKQMKELEKVADEQGIRIDNVKIAGEEGTFRERRLKEEFEQLSEELKTATGPELENIEAKIAAVKNEAAGIGLTLASPESTGATQELEQQKKINTEKIQEEERHALAIAQLEGEKGADIIAIRLNYAKKQLQALRQNGEAEQLEIEQQLNRIQELTKEFEDLEAIENLQGELDMLRERLTGGDIPVSTAFDQVLQRYIEKTRELNQLQSEDAEGGSLSALEQRVSQLQEMAKNTDLATKNFEFLKEALIEAQNELASAQERLKPTDNTEAYLEDLDEAERHQQALAEIEQRGEVERLDIQLGFLRARLQILEEEGKAETDQAEKIKNQIIEAEQQKLNAKKDAAEEEKRIEREKVDAIVSGIEQIISATANAVETALNIRREEIERYIDLQRERVERAQEIADQGNSAVLEAEEERLDELNRKREEFVRKQQALATIQLVAESSIAIAKAAAQGGVAAPFTIAATLLALTAGLAQAKAVAQQAAFYEGGYTGDGNPRSESTELGRKPYKYHKAEFVMDHKVTRMGNNRKYFQEILDKRIDLDDWFNKKGVTVVTGSDNKKELEDIRQAILNMPVPDFKLSERGVFTTSEKQKKNKIKLNKRLRS